MNIFQNDYILKILEYLSLLETKESHLVHMILNLSLEDSMSIVVKVFWNSGRKVLNFYFFFPLLLLLIIQASS